MGLQEFMEKLPSASAAPPYRVLAELSAIPDADGRKVAELWVQWRPQVLRQFLRRLVSLAEENILYEFEAVLKAALDSRDAGARAIALGGLQESSNKLLAQRFGRMLTDDPAEEVRVAAAMGLAKFAAMAVEGKMISRDYDRILEALRAAIERPDESREVRRRSIEAIAPYPEDVNRNYIGDAYQSGDRLLKQSALYAMGRSGARRWLPEITTAIESADAAIRYEAVTSLGLLGEEEDSRLLMIALEDDDIQVRASAVVALGRIGGAAARRIIQRELRSRIPAIVEAAREALEEMDLGDLMFGDQPGAMGIGPNGNGGNGRAR